MRIYSSDVNWMGIVQSPQELNLLREFCRKLGDLLILIFLRFRVEVPQAHLNDELLVANRLGPRREDLREREHRVRDARSREDAGIDVQDCRSTPLVL